jgi:hypothetical protein
MLKITITPKTINNIKVYVAIATVNLFDKVYATGNTHTQALNNIIKIIQ